LKQTIIVHKIHENNTLIIVRQMNKIIHLTQLIHKFLIHYSSVSNLFAFK